MNHKANSKQWWSDVASPTLELLGLQKPRHSNAAPIAISLGTVGTVAGAFLMREALARISRDLLSEGASLAKHMSPMDLLPLVGLERRRSTAATLGPALGAFALGAIAGTAAALWLGMHEEGHSDEGHAASNRASKHGGPTRSSLGSSDERSS